MIDLAKKFATHAHNSIGQIRKYTQEPYIVHPAAVAELVSEVTDDETIISAAWLHDVVEDTPYSIEDIRNLFGSAVAQIVFELTGTPKNDNLTRETRKAIDRELLKKASVAAKMIKLADIIDNTKSIETENPEFAKIYMMEKKLLLLFLKGANSKLYLRALAIIDGYYDKNGIGDVSRFDDVEFMENNVRGLIHRASFVHNT